MTPPRRRTQSGASRRDSILAAAKRLVSATGVKATSMRDLAREVGVTEGALYRHFDSKEALIAELFSYEASRLHGWLAHSLDETRGAWEQLDGLVAGFLDFGFREAESFRLILELHETAGLRAGPQVRLPREHFLSVLRTLAEQESVRVSDPFAVVLMIVGLLSRLIGGSRAGAVKLSRSDVVALAQRTARAVVDAARVPAGP
ncbi:MAG: TetR/AcrR family transcriptional regulator [Candidatus Wallbacteria bacterium]|nr:TetR/AcrR family transcriptional regulator [Candidatus Wallbacteria bacterium]